MIGNSLTCGIHRKETLMKTSVNPGPWNTLTNDMADTGGVLQTLDAGGAIEPRRFHRAARLP